MSCHVASSNTVFASVESTSVGRFRSVAIIGPPNSGKTTLFDRLTGLRQKMGNFAGVTVEQHSGVVKTTAGTSVRLISLPGVYGLSPKSEDVRLAIEVLRGQMAGSDAPDAVILVLGSTFATVDCPR